MIRSIVTDTNILSKRVQPAVTGFVGKVITDLFDTAYYVDKKPGGCAGLAANQIGHNVAVLLFWDGGITADGLKNYIVMINPVIFPRFGGDTKMIEGCLSRPGKTIRVKRAKKIKVSYFDEKGNLYDRVIFRAFTARIIQHEIDHLNGVYIS